MHPRILVAPVPLFMIIGLKCARMPQQVAARSQITLGSPAAATHMHAFGPTFLGSAIAILLSVLSTRQLLGGFI
jgi:hypothetical protein